MKRIAIVTHNMYGGGCERVIAELANWFVDNHSHCTIITEYEGPCFYHLKSEVNLLALSQERQKSGIDIVKSYIKLRKMMMELKPDIILAMPDKVNIWTALSLIGSGIPVVVSERNNPAIYPISKIKRLLREPAYRLATKGVIFQTTDAKSYFSDTIQKKGIVLMNPLDMKRIPEINTGMRNKEVVSVGRLEKQKNFHLLIEAFSEFQKVHQDYILTIYGEGSMKDELERYAREKLISNSFSFPGKRSDVLSLIRNAGIFVLSSDYEGMPNALIEAMALGLPVISTDCPIGGPRELIRDRDNGMLISVGGKEALVSALLEIVGNKELERKISRNALEIRGKLEINKIAVQWMDFLNSLVN
ncbi:glycosyl transferase [Paenibacillus sp. CCS19]|uniref:glycosyltransferase n=1 Tax=Paenibacillus sp. CCS19 TaxID=3158387 RepID=UPI0025695560|nr:glycosyltransferase [Paenibacillus cellulosilyticus]GMK38138.1 glycosyl transferase [Paenibacillus cellulosilyticus]